MSYLKDREIWLSRVPTGNPPTGYFWKFIQNGVLVIRDSSGVDKTMATTSGNIATASTASYVEYSNVANKPTLVSESAQIIEYGIFATTSSNQFNGSQVITGSLTVTEGVTGTATTASYVEYTGIANKPALVSESAQILEYGIFATTSSNSFNGSQTVTGSLTVTGQIVAQTLNVQQVTSSVVFSSGSNVFGNELGNTQQFTGSVSVTGSLSVNGVATSGTVSGTTNFVPKFTGASTIGNSIFTENGGNTLRIIAADAAIRLDGSRDYLLQTVDTDGRFRIFDQTAALERFTLSSTGNVGIGTPSPADLLNIDGGASYPFIRIQSSGNSTARYLKIGLTDALLHTIDAVGPGTSINFRTANSESMRITSDGFARLSATSGGIQFNGDTAAANALDDYEEGTWTPTIAARTGAYTTVTNQRGTYTKIGRQVTVQFYFIVSNKGTGTNGAQITNLPFTSLNTSIGDNYIGSMTNTSSGVLSQVTVPSNSVIANILKYDGTDSIIITQGNAGSVTYFV